MRMIVLLFSLAALTPAAGAAAAASPASIMAPLAPESIVSGERRYVPFQDAGHTLCTFVIDIAGKVEKFEHTLFAKGDSCTEVLASTKFERGGATYFVSMFKGLTRKHLAVFSVSKGNKVAAEKQLALKAGANAKMTTMRSVRMYLEGLIR